MDHKSGEGSARRYMPIPPSQSEVNSILKKKRKTREPRACYPCRHRKVKCDWHVPCQTCVDRGHADLCSYRPGPQETSEIQDSGDEAEVSDRVGTAVTRDEWEHVCGQLMSIERRLSDLQEQAARCPACSVARFAPRPSAAGPGEEWQGIEGPIGGYRPDSSDQPFTALQHNYPVFPQYLVSGSESSAYPAVNQAGFPPTLPYSGPQSGPGFTGLDPS